MGVSWIPFAFPGLPWVRCAFQTRRRPDALDVTSAKSVEKYALDHGNISFEVGDDSQRVGANREALRAALGFEVWQELKQVHGPAMVFDPADHDIAAPGRVEADGLATARRGQCLVIKSADCQPLLLAHRSGQFIAALHVGWRGNRIGFPATGVAAFCAQYSLDPAEILAVRGPSLGPAASEFLNFSSEWGEEFLPYYAPETRTVNLWRLTDDQLASAGLRVENIFNLDLCTYELPELFFSYRRDKHCGRQASLIWMD